MNAVEIEGLSFSFAGSERQALRDVGFALPAGSFTVICGHTGSGKTTLLRMLKPEIAPVGSREGAVRVFGEDVSGLSEARSAAEIGFVMQRPDNQIVMDTVWHELAFGLENIGMPSRIMRRRVAEVAHFFGINEWFDKRVDELSGGQKQTLNLASVLTLQPKLLVLDEPTSQLDPIASKDFLQLLARVNSELGITVFLCEHRLEEVLPISDRVLMIEQGAIVRDCSPSELCAALIEADDSFADALPASARIACRLSRAGAGACDGPHHRSRSTCSNGLSLAGEGEGEGAGGAAGAFELPLTVKDGRTWIVENGPFSREGASSRRGAAASGTGGSGGAAASGTGGSGGAAASGTGGSGGSGDVLLEAKEIWFRYAKDAPYVLKGASLRVRAGRIASLVGGNGSGKSTLLYALAGVRKCARGRVIKKAGCRVAVMAQDPKTLFVADALEDDLMEWAGEFGYSRDDACEMARRLGIGHLLAQHPYDLSGGEMQKAAFAKLLLTDPDVLLLDEPVKGLDSSARREVAAMLRELAAAGKAVLIVSHDLEFSAEVSSECSMMFSGTVICSDDGHRFFCDNIFFTTGVNRTTRELIGDCVVMRDLDGVAPARAGDDDGGQGRAASSAGEGAESAEGAEGAEGTEGAGGAEGVESVEGRRRHG